MGVWNDNDIEVFLDFVGYGLWFTDCFAEAQLEPGKTKLLRYPRGGSYNLIIYVFFV